MIDGQLGSNGSTNPFLAGGVRTAVPVAELPERQYRRIVEAEEDKLRARFGNGQGLGVTEAEQAQSAFDRLQALRQTRTAFLAQQIAQEDNGAREGYGAAVETDPGRAAIDAFRAIMEMTPEERLFELLLKKRGLTKEELDALPPEEREKIIAEITEEIREKIEKKSASAGMNQTQPAGEAAPGAEPAGRSGPNPSIEAAGSAAAISQQDIIGLAERRSPTGKVGFEDLLILATQGRDGLSRLSGTRQSDLPPTRESGSPGGLNPRKDEA